MPQPSPIEIDFPLAGLNRRWSYQRQAPYTSPKLYNVRPMDMWEKRQRGATRPPITRAYQELLGGEPRDVYGDEDPQHPLRTAIAPFTLSVGNTRIHMATVVPSTPRMIAGLFVFDGTGGKYPIFSILEDPDDPIVSVVGDATAERPGIVHIVLTKTNGGFAITYDARTNSSTINTIDRIPLSAVGKFFTFATSGHKYTILEVFSLLTRIRVAGDARSEASPDWFTIDFGKPVRMLTTVNPIPNPESGGTQTGGGPGSVVDPFLVTSTASPTGMNPDLWAALPGWGTMPEVEFETRTGRIDCWNKHREDGALFAEVPDYDNEESATVTLTGNTDPEVQHGHAWPQEGTKVHFYCKMSDSLPDPTLDGIHVTLQAQNNGVWMVQLVETIGGIDTYTQQASVTVFTGWTFILRVNIDPIPGRTEFIIGVSMANSGRLIQYTTTLGQANNRCGFAMENPANPVHPEWAWPAVHTRLFEFAFNYTKRHSTLGVIEPGGEPRPSILVASAGRKIYRESNDGRMELVISQGTRAVENILADDRLLMAAEYLGKLFIADWGPPKCIVTGASIENQFTITFPGANWLLFGIDPVTDVAVIFAATPPPPATPVVLGVYEIESVSSGGVRLKVSPGTTPATHTISVRIVRSGKVYDPNDTNGNNGRGNARHFLAIQGNAPANFPLVAVFKDRLYCGGADDAPHGWFASRSGDPFDWDFGADPDDPGKAIPGTDLDNGRISEPLTAFIAGSNDYFIMACERRMFVLRGDPGFGGGMDVISHVVGVICRSAWCRTPAGEIVFLSRQGLFVLQPGAVGEPIAISPELLPQELRDIEPAKTNVLLEYNLEWQGVEIWLSDNEDYHWKLHWFVAWADKSFWPQGFGKIDTATVEIGINQLQPSAITSHTPVGQSVQQVIFGCLDGYLRRYTPEALKDDGHYDLFPHALIGPVKLSQNPSLRAIITLLTMQFSTQSNPVKVSLWAEDTLELVLSRILFGGAVPGPDWFADGGMVAGLNYTDAPGVGGGAIGLLIEQCSDKTQIDHRWAIESIVAELEAGGPLLKL